MEAVFNGPLPKVWVCEDCLSTMYLTPQAWAVILASQNASRMRVPSAWKPKPTI